MRCSDTRPVRPETVPGTMCRYSPRSRMTGPVRGTRLPPLPTDTVAHVWTAVDVIEEEMPGAADVRLNLSDSTLSFARERFGVDAGCSAGDVGATTEGTRDAGILPKPGRRDPDEAGGGTSDKGSDASARPHRPRRSPGHGVRQARDENVRGLTNRRSWWITQLLNSSDALSAVRDGGSHQPGCC